MKEETKERMKLGFSRIKKGLSLIPKYANQYQDWQEEMSKKYGNVEMKKRKEKKKEKDFWSTDFNNLGVGL